MYWVKSSAENSATTSLRGVNISPIPPFHKAMLTDKLFLLCSMGSPVLHFHPRSARVIFSWLLHKPGPLPFCSHGLHGWAKLASFFLVLSCFGCYFSTRESSLSRSRRHALLRWWGVTNRKGANWWFLVGRCRFGDCDPRLGMFDYRLVICECRDKSVFRCNCRNKVN